MTHRNWLIFILLAVFMMMTTGCISRTICLEGRRVWPANPKFTIVPRLYKADELTAAGIRTDGVYVHYVFRPKEFQEEFEDDLRRNGYRVGSPYFRFWANGRILVGLSKMDVLTAKEVDCFEGGILGYFRFPTNGVLESEVYTYDLGRGGGAYSKYRRIIEGDTLWFTTHATHKGVPVQLGYRFVPIKGMTAQPDW
jgi:hypothetical protein